MQRFICSQNEAHEVRPTDRFCQTCGNHVKAVADGATVLAGDRQTRLLYEEHPLDVAAPAGQPNGQGDDPFGHEFFQQARPQGGGAPQPVSAPARKIGRGLLIGGVVVGLLFLALLAALLWQANAASQQEQRANEAATQAAMANGRATEVANNATVVAQQLNATATAVAGQNQEARNAEATASAATAQAQANEIATAQAEAATAQASANQAQAALLQFQTDQTATAIANATATAEAQLAADATATAMTQATADAAATAAAAPTVAPVIQATPKPVAKPFKNWYNQLSWTPSTSQASNGHTRVKALVSLPSGYSYDLSSMGLRLVGDPNGDKKPGAGAYWDLGSGRQTLQLIQFKAGGAAVVSETSFIVVDGQTTVVTFTGTVK